MRSGIDGVMRGRVWMIGDSVDTNQLAGPHDAAQTMEGYKSRCLVGVRPDFALNVKRGDIIVAGRNFGAGSSRQSAVEVLQYIGIQAVLAESVARLYFRTSISLAFPVFMAPGIRDITMDQCEVEIDYANRVVRNPVTHAVVRLEPYPPSVERIFEAGGLSNVIALRLKTLGITAATSE